MVEHRGLLEAGFTLAPVCERSEVGAVVLDKRVIIEQSGYRGLVKEVGGRYDGIHFLYCRKFSWSALLSGLSMLILCRFVHWCLPCALVLATNRWRCSMHFISGYR